MTRVVAGSLFSSGESEIRGPPLCGFVDVAAALDGNSQTRRKSGRVFVIAGGKEVQTGSRISSVSCALHGAPQGPERVLDAGQSGVPLNQQALQCCLARLEHLISANY